MPSSDDRKKELTDVQLLRAKEQIQEAVIAIETALAVLDIPEGMVLVAMSRMIGLRVRRGTLALGPEVRREHVDGFCEIIKAHAFGEEGDDGDKETS